MDLGLNCLASLLGLAWYSVHGYNLLIGGLLMLLGLLTFLGLFVAVHRPARA